MPGTNVEGVVERVYDELLENNLFFILEDVEEDKKAVQVVVGLHRHKSFHDRIIQHPLVTEPMAALTAALGEALPQHTVKVELFPIDVEASAFELYLRKAGEPGAALLAEFRKQRKPRA